MSQALAEAPPASTRSPERSALADAIENFNAAILYRDRVDTAHKRINDAILQFYPKLDDAEETVRKAKGREGARLVATLIGNADDTPSLADAESALSKVQTDHAQAKADRDRLAEELAKADQHVELARGKVRSAVQAVVTAEGRISDLIAYYDTLREQVAAMNDVLNIVLFALPVGFNGHPLVFGEKPRVLGSSALAARWREALAALETDADAPLPDLEV